MADTVVTIGGDSTGLQGAFKDAGKSAGTVKVEAKKLSDQLKEVADDADKAAGALAQKLGGPGAIKAIAGVGAAMGIAKAGVEAFLDSSENLFKSYGDAGQKVWDDTEKSLFAVKGAFAEAVLGGGSMEEMGARLKGIFDGVKIVMDAILSPLRLVASTLWDISRASSAVTTERARGLEIDNQYALAIGAITNATNLEKESVDALLVSLGDVFMSKQQSAALEYSTTLQKLDNAIANNREAREFRANAAADLAAAQAVEAEIKAGLGAYMAQAMREVKSPDSSRRVAMLSYEERARELLAADQSFQAQLRLTTNAARDNAYRSMNVASAAELAQEAVLLTKREEYVQKAAELQFLIMNPPKAASTSSAPAKPAGAEDPIAFARMYGGALQELTAESVAAIQASEVAYGESTTSVITTTRSKLDTMLADNAAALAAKEAQESESMNRLADAKAKRAEEDAAIVSARSAAAYQFEVDEANKKIALAEQTAAAEAASFAKLKGDLYTLTVNNSAKMLAVDLQDKEKSKTAAQRATAAVIQGLGDMAMVKSGLAAAAGNFAEAAGFSVVGTLAYGIAAKLAPSEKTKTTAPAAATGGGGGTTNTSYNLRVDAAFADGESVARRFAEMQQGAQRRGLI